MPKRADGLYDATPMNVENVRKRAKRQHLVPQFYLRYFADGEKVWVIDFHSNCPPYQTNITNALCIKDFYTVSTKEEKRDDIIELWLSSIEGAVKPILDRLLKDMVIPRGKDKEIIAAFLATLFLRGPHARQVQLELYESTIKAFSDRYFADEAVFEKNWQEFMAKRPGSTLTRETARTVLRESVIEGFLPRESYITSFMKTFPRQAALFNYMVLKVWWADPSARARFITCDFPFVFEDKSDRTFGIPPKGGLLNKNVRIYVPLTPLTCLILEHTGESMICPIPPGMVIPIINSQIAVSATRYVVSKSSELYWYKGKQVHRSADDLHKEFYPAKLTQPAVELISVGRSQKVTARNNWNKLKGDIP